MHSQSRLAKRKLQALFCVLSLVLVGGMYSAFFAVVAEKNPTDAPGAGTQALEDRRRFAASAVVSHIQGIRERLERDIGQLQNQHLPPRAAQGAPQANDTTDDIPLRISSGSKWFKYVLEPVNAVSDCGQLSSQVSSTRPQYTICTHGLRDVVSSFIHRDGFWRDCIPQIALATLVRMHMPPVRGGGFSALDIGGNIGSCATLLASRGFQVISFEPVQRNADIFRRTISANHMGDKVQLVKAALGTESESTFDITVEIGNHGNSVMIDKKSTHGANVLRSLGPNHPETITVLKLDDLVAENEKQLQGNVHFHFAKLDCQGSELTALLGGEASLLADASVDLFYIEIDTKLSRAVGNEPKDLLELLHRHGYTMFWENELKTVPIVQSDFASFADGCVETSKDIVALSRPLLEKMGLEKLRKLFTIHQQRLVEWLRSSDAGLDLPRNFYAEGS